MVEPKQIASLVAQKQLLLAEAEVHRRVVSAEIKALCSSLGWVNSTRRTAKVVRPLGMLLALTAGLFLARRTWPFSNWGLRSLALWRLGRRFWKS